MKRRKMLLLGLIMIISMTGGVFAATLSTYNPVKNTKTVTVLFNDAYSGANGDPGARKNVKGVGVANRKLYPVKPVDEDYRFGMVPGSGSKKTAIIKGKNYGYKLGYEYAEAMGGKDSATVKAMKEDAKALMWFHAEDYPEIEIRGYKIFNGTSFVHAALRAKLVSYTRSNKSYGAKQKKTPLIAFSDISKDSGIFNGLPTVIINSIGNAQVRYRFYKTKNTGEADLDQPFNIRTNVTYDDIDCYQALSIKKMNSAGFAATNSAGGNLRFGGAGEFWAVNSNTSENKSGDQNKNSNWDRHAMCFYINNSEVNMIYTSNQRQVKDNKQTSAAGEANGQWSYFSTITYNAAPQEPALGAPVKKVFDETPSNDVEPDNTHNKLAAANESFYYTVTQIIPEGLSPDTVLKYGLDSLTFSDKLDSCLKTDGKVMFYKNSISASNDITNCFNNNSNGGSLVYKSKNNAEARSQINLSGNGGTIIMKVPVRISKSDEDLTEHISDNLSDTGKNGPHRIEGTNLLDIPNEAKVEYRTTNNKSYSNRTGIVKTRIAVFPKHDLIIEKQVAGPGASTKKRFEFELALNNGSKFSGTIERSDNSTEEISVEKRGTFSLAHGERMTLYKIPQTVKFTITEKANEKYTPSFSLSDPGNCLETGAVTGSAAEGHPLSVTDRIMQQANYKTIKYTFLNTGNDPPPPPPIPVDNVYPYTHLLKTVKTEEPDTGRSFSFNTILRGLTEESYMIMKPGSGNFRITMSESGDITLAAENYPGSIEGIPVKLIRPCDRQELICFTDESGVIHSGEFIKWLSHKQSSSFDFMIEWNGGYIDGHYVEQ